MNAKRPYSDALTRLREAGLRPTRQRMALARLLFDAGDRHVTAEQLFDEARGAGIPVSLATVYNTLNHFTEAGLMREVVVEPGRAYYDTNTRDHHHFFFVDDGRLQDISAEEVSIGDLPGAPDGAEVERVDVIVRVKSSD